MLIYLLYVLFIVFTKFVGHVKNCQTQKFGTRPKKSAPPLCYRVPIYRYNNNIIVGIKMFSRGHDVNNVAYRFWDSWPVQMHIQNVALTFINCCLISTRVS